MKFKDLYKHYKTEAKPLAEPSYSSIQENIENYVYSYLDGGASYKQVQLYVTWANPIYNDSFGDLYIIGMEHVPKSISTLYLLTDLEHYFLIDYDTGRAWAIDEKGNIIKSLTIKGYNATERVYRKYNSPDVGMIIYLTKQLK